MLHGWNADCPTCRGKAVLVLAAADAVDTLRAPRDPASATAAHAKRTGPRNWTLFEPARRVFGPDGRKLGRPDD